MLWASRKMQPASLPYNATNLLTVFGPPFFGNVSRHAFFENSCFWLFIRTLLLRIQYSSPFVSQKLSAALLAPGGPGWTFDSTDSHGSEASHWGWDLQTSRGVDVQLGCSLNHPWCSTISTSIWIRGKLSQASQHTGGERLEYTSLTA